MSAPTYRSGNTTVQALQWPDYDDDSYASVCARARLHRWVWANGGHTWVTTPKANPDDVHVRVETIAGQERIESHDWVLLGDVGTFYRCSAEDFARDWTPAASSHREDTTT